MKKLIVLFVLSVCFNLSYGQEIDRIANQLTKDIEKIYAQGHLVGFAVAIVDAQGTTYEKGFGYADKQQSKKYTKHTIQNIASISKTFIGVSLLKAQELGKLKLDDPINDYLPFKVINPHFPNQVITIRHLTTHTSGIKDPKAYEKYGYVIKSGNSDQAEGNKNFRPSEEYMTYQQFLEKILSSEGEWYRKSTFLKTKAGKKFEYSNIATGLAAFVLEGATGESLSEFTKKHIFDPLEMNDTGWSFEEVDLSNHTKLYKDLDTELAYYHLINYPDGGLITSASSLAKYLSELISGSTGNGKILNTESYTELFKGQLSDLHFKKRSNRKYNDEYNMGVFMGMSSQNQIGHTGGDPAVTTFMFFNSETNTGKVLILNTDLNKEGVQEFIAVWQTLEEYENKF